jgi:hypothetical protein
LRYSNLVPEEIRRRIDALLDAAVRCDNFGEQGALIQEAALLQRRLEERSWREPPSGGGPTTSGQGVGDGK